MSTKLAALVVATLCVAGPVRASDPLPLNWNDPPSLVAAALANSPTLQRLQSEVTAARERIQPATAQPNPMLMLGIDDKMVTLEDDEMMTMYAVGLSQTITRPSKIEARRRAAELAVRQAELQLGSARAEIERDVLFAWYDLATVHSQTTATLQVRELVDGLVDAARVRYEVGTSVQAEVIRAQLTRSDLDRQLLRLRGARDAAVARLLPLLGLPPGTEVPRFGVPESAKAGDIDGPLAIADSHPAFAALRAEAERQNATIEAIGLEAKPDFGVAAEFGHRRTQTDMFSASVTIELPVRKSRTIEPRIREAIALREAALRRIEELRRTLVRDLAVAKAAHDEMTEQLRFFEEVLVPQSKLAIDSTLASYQTGRSTFEAVLATESTYLRLQLEYFDYLSRHARAVIDFEAIQRGARAGATAGGSAPMNAASAAPAQPMASPAM